MKKMVLIMCVGILIVACGGNKAEVKDKQKVIENVSGTEFTIDSLASSVVWTAFHKGRMAARVGIVMLTEGKFSIKNEKVTSGKFAFDIANLTVTSLEGEDQQKLQGHLRSGDFFDVENFPTAVFEITEVTGSEEEGFNTKISGNLTIKDTTRNLSFDAKLMVGNGTAKLISEKFTVNRSDWDLTYNKDGTPGIPDKYIISDDIDFFISVLAAAK